MPARTVSDGPKRGRDSNATSGGKQKKQKSETKRPSVPADEDLPRGGTERDRGNKKKATATATAAQATPPTAAAAAADGVRRRAAAAADSDNLFGGAVVKKALQVEEERKARKKPKKKKASAPGAVGDEELRAAAGELLTAQQAPKRVEALTFKTLSVGMSLLAAVAEVTDLDVVLSLPNNLKGSVNMTEISDVLTDRLERQNIQQQQQQQDEAEEPPLPELRRWFSAGQLVPCAVVQLLDTATAGRRVELSTRARIINQGIARESLSEGLLLAGAVRSVEDHGYIIDLGLPFDCRGFVPIDGTARGGRDSPLPLPLEVGQPIYGVVTAVDTAAGRAVTLSLDPVAVARATAKQSHVLTMESLKAGQLVPARIRKRLPNGLWLSFLDYFTGSVDAIHLRSDAPAVPPAAAAADNAADVSIVPAESYREGAKVKARVLWVDYEAKQAGLSLQQHIVQLRPHRFPAALRAGSFVDNAVVERVESGLGLMLRLPPTDTDTSADAEEERQQQQDGEQQQSVQQQLGQAAFVHISHVSDAHTDRLERRFKPGDVVPRCRVLSLDALDALVVVTLRASVLEQPIMSLADVQPGMRLDGTIARITPEAILVSITDSIQGRCAAMHFADVRIQDPAKKFQEGEKFKVRVLTVDPARRRLQLTHKRTLVQSDLPILDTWEAARVGIVTHGYVTKVAPFGCIVSFYGEVHGLVPAAELSSQYVPDPQKAFQMGQVVTCRVIDSDPATKKLRLSLKTLTAGPAETAVASSPFETVSAGQLVSATVKALINDGAVLLVETDDGVSGMVPLGHLADHAAHAERLLPRLAARVGTKLTELLVVDKHPAKRTLLLSLKPSLISAAKAGKLPSSFDQLRTGMVLSGWVKGVTNFGVFVGLLGGVSGLAHRSHVSDTDRHPDVEQLYAVNQSVRAYVSEVDVVGGKVSFSLQPSLTATAATPDEPSWLELYFRHDEFISRLARTAKERAKVPAEWTAAYPVGGTVDAELSMVKPFGAVFKLPSPHITGFAISYHHQQQHDQTVPEDARQRKMRARVLDLDPEKLIVDLSLRTVPASSDSNNSNKQAASAMESLRVGATAVQQATVELVKENYLVVSLSSGLVGFVQVREFNEVRDAFSAYKPGQKLRVSVLRKPLPDELVPRLLLAAVRTLPRSRHSQQQQQQAAEGQQLAAGDSAAALSSLDQVAPGMTVQCKVTGVFEAHLALSMGLHLHGRMHITEVYDEPPAEAQLHPFAAYPVGTEFPARIIAFSARDSDKYLPITHQNPHRKALIDVSVRPSVMALPEGEPLPDEVTWRLSATLDSVQPGQWLLGVVQSVTLDAAWLIFSRALRGRLFVLESSDDLHDLTFFQERYRPGQVLRCRVLSVDLAKRSFDLTLKGSASTAAAAPSAPNANGKKTKKAKQLPSGGSCAVVVGVVPGAVVPGRISKLLPGVGLMVQLGAHVYGRVHLTDLSDVFRADPLSAFEPLQFVNCYVLAVQDKSRIDLSLRASRLGSAAAAANAVPGAEQTLEAAGVESVEVSAASGRRKGPFAAKEISEYSHVHPGDLLAGYVQLVKDRVGVMVAFGRDVCGRATFRELADDFIKSPEKVFPVGKLVLARVKAVDLATKRIELSLRPSAVDASRSARRYFADLKLGDKVDGKVKSVVPGTGVFIQIAHSSVTGLCHVSEIADEYLKDATAQYKVGDAVRALIIKLDTEKKRVSFSLKPSHFADDSDGEIDSDAAADEDEDAAETSSSEASGSEAESEGEASPGVAAAAAAVRVKNEPKDAAEVASAPSSKRKAAAEVATGAAAAGQKKVKREAAEQAAAAAGSGGGQPAKRQKQRAAAAAADDDDDDAITEQDIEALLADGERDEEMAIESAGEEESEAVPPAAATARAGRTAGAAAAAPSRSSVEEAHGAAAAGGLRWEAFSFDDSSLLLATPSAAAAAAAADTSDDEGGTKRGRRAKKSEKLRQERLLAERERAMQQQQQAPTTAADFERLLLSSPSSSYAWIQYVAHHVALHEIDKARAVAERALKTIDGREEAERRNVWLAWLNLENQFGSDDSLAAVFARALAASEPKPLYLSLADILDRSGKLEKAEELFKTMTKKFAASSKVWRAYATFLLAHGRTEQFRAMLAPCLKALPKRKHLPMIAKCGQLEFRQGSAERGRTIFEGIVSNYPKRVDLWNVYLDMELRTGQRDTIRHLFERVTSLTLSSKKMKHFFKRYLEYEKTQGDVAAIERIKDKARQYVASKTSSS